MALGLSQKFTNGLVNELNAKCSEAGKQWVRKDLMCSHCRALGTWQGFPGPGRVDGHVPISSRRRQEETKSARAMSALTYCGHATQTINLEGRRICLAHGSRDSCPVSGGLVTLDPSS